MRTDTGEQERQRHKYIFVIRNEPREIERIVQRLIKKLNPGDFYNICDIPVPGSNGLHCRAFSFSSDFGKMERPEEIYDRFEQFKYDRDLREGDESQLIPYLERVGMLS